MSSILCCSEMDRGARCARLVDKLRLISGAGLNGFCLVVLATSGFGSSEPDA